MNYDEKLSAASDLITQHNASGAEPIDLEQFKTKLRALGGTTDQALRECSWEDLQKCELPAILARVVAKLFRSNGETKKGFSRRQVDAMSIEELLRAYDDLEPENAVGRRLKAITAGKRCLIFGELGNVTGPDGQTPILVEPSAVLVREIRSGFPELKEYEWQGRIYKTYAVGEKPNITFDENPLFPGQPLRSGDVCGITGFSWRDVSLAVKQIFYLAITKTGEIKDMEPLSIHQYQSWAESVDGAEARVRKYLRKTAVLYDELAATGSLPSLKIKPSETYAKIPAGRRVL